MNPSELTDQQYLTIWTCCFDADQREGIELAAALNCLREWLGSSDRGNIGDLEGVALKLWEHDEVALASQFEEWALERRELN